MAKRVAEVNSKMELLRCLKRYLSREVVIKPTNQQHSNNNLTFRNTKGGILYSICYTMFLCYACKANAIQKMSYEIRCSTQSQGQGIAAGTH